MMGAVLGSKNTWAEMMQLDEMLPTSDSHVLEMI
jgi:hypothetical protein